MSAASTTSGVHTLIILSGLKINMCHVLEVKHGLGWGEEVTFQWNTRTLMYVCVWELPLAAAMLIFQVNQLGNSLLSNVYHPLLLVRAQSYESSLISKSLWINGNACAEALKLRTASTVLYSQSAPEFCAVTATLERPFRSMSDTHTLAQRRKRCTNINSSKEGNYILSNKGPVPRAAEMK